MLIKRKTGSARSSALQAVSAGLSSGTLDRRSFLKKSGLAAGGLAAFGAASVGTIRKAEAGPMKPGVPVVTRKNICTHCSVGCSVIGEMQNGVWVGQEPASPEISDEARQWRVDAHHLGSGC